MALSDGDFDLIEKYLEQDLTSEEQATFESKLTYPAFAEELERQKTALGALEIVNRTKLKKELHELLEEVNQQTPTSPAKIAFGKYLAIAATFILFVVSIGYYLTRPNSTDELYLSYYRPFPADPVTRGANSNLLGETMNAYRLQNYEQASKGFEAILLEHPDSLRLYLFLGNSYLNRKQPQQAINSFSKAAQSKDAFIRQHGQWYLVMAYLKDNDKTLAVPLLKKLLLNEGIYRKEAKLLLDELD